MTRVEQILESWPDLLLARNSRSRLYKSLVLAMELIELCENNQTERAAFTNAVAERPPKGNRTFIEAGSDSCTRVCRFLFINESHHNISRYAVALRKALSRGQNHITLFNFLVTEGGVNNLTQYNRKPPVCPHCGEKLED